MLQQSIDFSSLPQLESTHLEERGQKDLGLVLLPWVFGGVKDIDFVGRSEAETPLKQER